MEAGSKEIPMKLKYNVCNMHIRLIIFVVCLNVFKQKQSELHWVSNRIQSYGYSRCLIHKTSLNSTGDSENVSQYVFIYALHRIRDDFIYLPQRNQNKTFEHSWGFHLKLYVPKVCSQFILYSRKKNNMVIGCKKFRNYLDLF